MPTKGTALTNKIDIVRLKIGDTDMSDPLLTNNEIATHVVAWPDNPNMAAAEAAESISAKFSRQYNFVTDGQYFNRSEAVNHYLALAQELRNRGATYAYPAGTEGTAIPTWTPQAGIIQ